MKDSGNSLAKGCVFAIAIYLSIWFIYALIKMHG